MLFNKLKRTIFSGNVGVPINIHRSFSRPPLSFDPLTYTPQIDIDFHSLSGPALSSELRNLPVSKLREMCKEYRIKRYTLLRKNTLVLLLVEHFLSPKPDARETALLSELLGKNYPVELNKEGQLNISVWFRDLKVPIRKKDLTRPRFLRIKNFHLDDKGIMEEKAITLSPKGDTFIDFELAIALASFKDESLSYRLIKHHPSTIHLYKGRSVI